MATAEDHDHLNHRRPRVRLALERARVRPERDLPRFIQLVAEVLVGERPPNQLRAHLSEGAYRSLRLRAGCYWSSWRPRLQATRLGLPHPGIAEVSGVIACGLRHRALALRIVYAKYSWLCTHIETDVRG